MTTDISFNLAELIAPWHRLTPDAQASLLRIARAKTPANATAASHA